jgi:hypothetical protein
MRSGMKRKFHVPFWRAAALVREPLTLLGSQALQATLKRVDFVRFVGLKAT